MRIGTLKTKDDHKSYEGSLTTLKASIHLVLHKAAAKRSEDSPDYDVAAVNGDGELVPIGSAWIKNSEANGRKVRFLSLTLDDPSWDRPLNVAAFPTGDKPNILEIAWRRERQDRAA